jgi:hypothetical protein
MAFRPAGHHGLPALGSKGLGPVSVQGTVPPFFYYLNLFFDLNIHRNSIILPKYIENGLNLRKI